MKLKTLLTIVFITLTIWSFAQPMGDIQKDTALANQYFEQALTLIERVDTNDQVKTLLEKANVLYEAHPYHNKIIEIKGLLAYEFLKRKQIKTAKTLIQTALDLAEKQHQTTTNLPSLCYVYAALYTLNYRSDQELAIQYGLKAIALTPPKGLFYFTIAKTVIHRHGSSGKLEKMDSLIIGLENVIDNQKDGRFEKYRMFVYELKADYYFEIFNNEQAIIYLQKVFKENKKHQLLLANELFTLYISLAKSHAALQHFDEALHWMDKAIATSGIEKNSPDYGILLDEKGSIYSKKRDYKTSIIYKEKGLPLLLQDTAKYKEDILMAYHSLADAYIQNEELDKAEATVKESLKLKNFFTQNYQLGKILGLQGKYEESVKYLHSSILQLSTNFKDTSILKNPSPYEVYKHWIVKFIFFNKGKYLYKWGLETGNKEYMQLGAKTIEYTLKMEEKAWQKAKGFDQSKFSINKNLLIILDVVTDQHYEIYNFEPSAMGFNEFLRQSERRKAIQLIETLSPSRLPKQLYEEEQRLVKNLQEKGQQLDLAITKQQKGLISTYENELFEASQNMENYFFHLKKDYPKEVNGFYNLGYAKLGSIQKILSKKTLLISYNNENNSKKNYIVTIGSATHNIYKTSYTDLFSDIKKLNELIQDPFAFQNGVRDEFIDISHKLYNTLIKPIESELEGKTKLMIVLEGQLFNLPFELLLKSNEKKPYHELDFLIKKYAVNYHYSATAFLKLQEKATVKDHSLLAFAPVFSKGEVLTEATRSLVFLVDSLYSGIDGNAFVALPNTKKEVNAIAKTVKSNNGKTNVLLQKKATKSKFAQQLESQSYQFIHIATHGLVNFKNPKLSALACYSKNKTMDNLMYANEIQFKDINADLVVLSSCESGIGQLVEGEGLIALNRSFIYSGAKNVLFSLWKVSDKYSSNLMIDFYKNYFDNQSYTTALHNAKLKMLSNPTSAQPKFWSAFVLMGE